MTRSGMVRAWPIISPSTSPRPEKIQTTNSLCQAGRWLRTAHMALEPVMKPHKIAWVNTYGFKLFVSSNELVNIGKAKAVDPTTPPINTPARPLCLFRT